MATLNFDKNGGAQYVYYSLTCNGTISAGTTSEWMSVGVTKTNSTSGKITVTVQPNNGAQKNGVVNLSVNGGTPCTKNEHKINVTQAAGGGGGGCSGVVGRLSPDQKTWYNSTSACTFTLSTDNGSCSPVITGVTSSDISKFTVIKTSNTTFKVTPVGDASTNFNGTCSVQYTVNGETRNPITVVLNYNSSSVSCRLSDVRIRKTLDLDNFSWGKTENDNKLVFILTSIEGCLTNCTATITPSTSTAFSKRIYTMYKFPNQDDYGYEVDVYPTAATFQNNESAVLRIDYEVQGGSSGYTTVGLFKEGTSSVDYSNVNATISPQNNNIWNDTVSRTFKLNSNSDYISTTPLDGRVMDWQTDEGNVE